VTIRADKNIVLQVFVDVLDVVKKASFEKVTLQTEVTK
jgi:biopolymer transport protein ExbD